MQKISLTKIDLCLFNLINGYAKKSRLLDFFGIFCAQYLGYFLLIWLLIFGYNYGLWQYVFTPLIAGLTSLAFNELVYLFYKRKRPMELLKNSILIDKPFSPAFPSSHTSFFVALSLTLFLFNIPLAIIFLALSFCISFFRVFCAVHWPSDILGGLISAIIAFLVIYFTGL